MSQYITTIDIISNNKRSIEKILKPGTFTASNNQIKANIISEYKRKSIYNSLTHK